MNCGPFTATPLVSILMKTRLIAHAIKESADAIRECTHHYSSQCNTSLIFVWFVILFSFFSPVHLLLTTTHTLFEEGGVGEAGGVGGGGGGAGGAG